MLPAACLLLYLCLQHPADSSVTHLRDTLVAAGTVDRREGRAILDSSSPAWRVSSADIERSGARSLHEALRTLPGLQVQDYGGVGGLKTVSVRGLGAAHTAVCLDGVLLCDSQHGSIDLAGFVEEVHPLSDAPAVYTRLAAGGPFPNVQFDWTSSHL